MRVKLKTLPAAVCVLLFFSWLALGTTRRRWIYGWKQQKEAAAHALLLISPREILIWWPKTKRIMASYFESKEQAHTERSFSISLVISEALTSSIAPRPNLLWGRTIDLFIPTTWLVQKAPRSSFERLKIYIFEHLVIYHKIWWRLSLKTFYGKI